MRTKNYLKVVFALSLGVFGLLFAAQSAAAQIGGFGIAPMRKEISIPAGSEKTFALSVNYSMPNDDQVKARPLRIAARMTDWTLNPNGNVKIADTNTLPRSAASWVIYTPAEFVIQPNTSQILRFTVSVPKETAPGDYRFAVYVEDRDPPPPATGNNKLLNVGFRFFSLIYVMVPGLTHGAQLAGLETKIENGAAAIVPPLKNTGNSFVRPQHGYEIRDAADQIVAAMKMQDAVTVLGETTMQPKLQIPIELPAGKYKVNYSVDFGIEKTPVVVGKTSFEITAADVLARSSSKPDSKAAQPTAAAQPEQINKAAGLPAPAEKAATDQKDKSKASGAAGETKASGATGDASGTSKINLVSAPAADKTPQTQIAQRTPKQ